MKIVDGISKTEAALIVHERYDDITLREAADIFNVTHVSVCDLKSRLKTEKPNRLKKIKEKGEIRLENR